MPLSDITIRPVTKDDLADIACWAVATPLLQRYQVRQDQIESQLHQALAGKDILLLAEVPADCQSCGFIWCQPFAAFGRSAYLRTIIIKNGYTGKNIGSSLLTRIEGIVSKTCDDLFLLVSDFNVAAQRFYRRHEYRQIGSIPGYVLPDVTELIFRKKLKAERGLSL